MDIIRIRDPPDILMNRLRFRHRASSDSIESAKANLFHAANPEKYSIGSDKRSVSGIFRISLRGEYTFSRQNTPHMSYNLG